MARTIHLGCWVEYQGEACVVLDAAGATLSEDPTSLDLWRKSPSGGIEFVGTVNRRGVRLLVSHSDLSALATSVMESSRTQQVPNA